MPTTNTEIAISLKNISKTFKVYENRNNSIKSAFRNIFKSNEARSIHALKDINVEIKKGEHIGIIGRNGSGKSTLIKIISGVYQPDKGGQVETKGKMVKLALATGFIKEFSARQNIYINGSLLGMSFKQIGERFERIINMAGLHDFVDTKLKYYSSGMRMRLAFAIAMFVEADTFLIDEFFGGVGDENFKRKSAKIFQSAFIKGKTIVNVSHSIKIIKKNSTRVIWLDNGNIKMIGKTDEVIEKYLESFQSQPVKL